MSETLHCPKCQSKDCYFDGNINNCPICAHEWLDSTEKKSIESDVTTKDAFGTVLNDGDTITVIKDLKVKGSSLVVKVGTKVKGIRLIDGDHDIDCKIKGIGSMQLKSQFVKKVIE